MANSQPGTSNEDEEQLHSRGSANVNQLIDLMLAQLKEQKEQRIADQRRFETIFQSHKDDLQTMLDSTLAGQSSFNLNHSYTSNAPKVAKLEPMKLPQFNGDYAQWKSYQDIFISIVDKNDQLSKSQKLHYLKDSLKGEALASIDHLTISDENYDAAWEIVKSGYDNKVMIVNAHIEKFLKLPAISNPSASSLKSLYSGSRSILQALEAIKVTQRDPWLIYFISQKLDDESKTLWSREIASSLSDPKPSASSSLSCTENGGGLDTQVLLATARVKLIGHNNEVRVCRAILDAGSQVNLITTNLRQQLRIPTQYTDFTLEGVGSKRHVAHQSVSISLQIGNSSNHRVSLDCLVMKKITSDQPSRPIDAKCVPIPPQFTLADPDWNKRQSIDLLIGGQYFWQFIQEGSHSIGKDAPLLKQSVFGWLVVGPCNIESHSNSPRNLMCHVSTLSSIESAIKKFWEIEEIDRPKDQVAEYKEVEDQFASTTTRNAEGRYIVELPFNEKVNELGNNQAAATKQLFYLERRLNKNSDLKQEYSNVFNEYLSLNIIEAVPFNEMGLASYYLPHHCVIREQSTSTKVRIVFNASSKSQSGLSLNDCLKVGPVVQPTLVSVLLRFRQHKFALTCDIVKMYLQVLLEPRHRDYQRFVWRENADDPVKAFRFRTVCFGVAPSPFLATRVLNQLVADEGEDFPLASRAILSNFYVDDCLTSVTSVEELLELKGQLISLLNRAGMQLSKFKSNCPYAIEDKPATQETLNFEDETVKTLGMIWNPNSDTFQYIVQEIIEDQPITKRLILSTIARIFDPIGLISPLITKAKLIFQSTWEVSTTWDQPVPDDLSLEWKIFVEDLPLIQYLRIPRWVSSIENPSSNELHAFCDASFVAYGAAIYLVCEDANGQRSSRLLTAKSKITPLKNKVSQSLTIPKAELCGAVMATELMSVVSQSLQISDHFFWTDATIILHQIHSPHERRELFVKRRAAKILSVSNPQQWRHVPTLENPADILSRGALPGKLKNSVLWWQGPQFIRKEPQHWPPPFDASSQFPIVDEQVTLINVPAESSDSNPIYSYLTTNIGSYNRIRRVLAWCIRTVNVFKLKLKRCTRQTAAQSTSEFLKTHELGEADKFLVRWDQQEHFDQILVTIKTKNFNTSQRFAAIRKLRPFLDSDNILRVGGRLQKSGEPYDVRHPKLLAKKSILARLIATHTHLSLLHAGPQLILAQLRQAYWPMDGRNLCRSITHNCIKCIKANPPQQEQLMGELPEHRVTAIKAFQATGVDFAGPLLLKSVNRKGSPIKAYVAVFVCMGTKALHLELVSALETDAFIATLRRFVARRGLPTHMYSDQGTTFIGADNELKRMFQQTKSQEIFANFLSERNIQWCFQPPKAPHHGGLWEAAVKSCKFHLKRILGQTPLTFEELQTTLSEIEAVLNSRPLVPISTHPDDPSCLTPGHFLTGTSLTQLPDPDLKHLPMNRLDRWQLCQKICQDFSSRWKREYLNTLQVRSKWTKSKDNLKVGDIVLFMEDNLPSTCWPLGKVVEIHPGKDQKVRVITVKTSRGNLKRPISKVVKLPVEPMNAISRGSVRANS
ncbi:uncharacterized protein LOC129808920 [Phlebotomus papatasi]|uniref:uncharacterized protein LOC129808920 n=1 Tax=Phlebotomus papatasi TaxID=29031 RepID=UPI002483E079|nr:uncharacterized protein LOC129808920 [Phlebotomus papatasi]